MENVLKDFRSEIVPSHATLKQSIKSAVATFGVVFIGLEVLGIVLVPIVDAIHSTIMLESTSPSYIASANDIQNTVYTTFSLSSIICMGLLCCGLVFHMKYNTSKNCDGMKL